MEWWQQLGFDSEEEAIARGDFEEVFIEEYRCEICNKTYKKYRYN